MKTESNFLRGIDGAQLMEEQETGRCAIPQRTRKQTELERVLMRRDGLSVFEALELVEEAREAVANGADPEEVLYNDFGLEPDFVFDLL